MAPTQSSRWVFTLNNPLPHELEEIQLALTPLADYFVIGRETAPTTGTPHLQGFVIFKRRWVAATAKAHFPRPPHIEAARGPSHAAATYCKKDGDFVEFGTCNPPAGKRKYLDEFLEWVDVFELENSRRVSRRDIAQAHPAVLLRHRNLMEVLGLRAPPIVLCFDPVPLPWQESLEEILMGEPDDRVVNFCVDTEGGKGKSWFQRYLLTKFPERVQLLGPGKREDIAHCIDVTRDIFLLNVPRNQMEFLNYSILEQLKDRCVFSPKYESQMKILTHQAHVVVFSNERPDMNKMTADRYSVALL